MDDVQLDGTHERVLVGTFEELDGDVTVPLKLLSDGEHAPIPIPSGAAGRWRCGRRAGVAASTSGLVLGGLPALVSWRLIFFVSVPAGLAALALLARSGRSPHHSVPFDWSGQAASVRGVPGSRPLLARLGRDAR